MKTKNKVAQYRKNGYKVCVNHLRPVPGQVGYVPYSRKTKGPVLSRGGITHVSISTPEGDHHFAGGAECGRKDNFCYRMGVQIALGRIEKEMEERGVNL